MSMKMSRETYARIEQAIRALEGSLDMTEVRNRYRAGDFPRADRVRDLEMRFRWDLFWAARQRLSTTGRDALSDALRTEELNDEHIDTALRQIVAPLGQS